MRGKIILTVAMVAAFAVGQTVGRSDEEQGVDESERPQVAWREGDRFKALGQIEESGDRFIFFPEDGETPLRLLENLSLERIAWISGDSSRQNNSSSWQVEGTIYEFRGTYYLLIDRAIVKARPANLGQLP